jgi:hypothetical protein
VLRRLGESLIELSELRIPADQRGSAHPALILPVAHS